MVVNGSATVADNMKKSKKALAFALFDQGKRPSDPEVKALDVKRKSIYAYFQEHKKLHPKGEDATTIGENGITTGEKGTTISKAKSGTPTTPVTVGRITITPENWGFTQEGAILVLDTYNKAKRDIGYGGTIGDFLCDVCTFYRRILNYREVEYGRATGEGRGGGEEDGRTSLEPVLESA